MINMYLYFPTSGLTRLFFSRIFLLVEFSTYLGVHHG